MDIALIIPHVEALIFAADRPLPPLELVELLNNAEGFLEDKATLEQVETALEAIREKYSSEFYAFEIRQSGGGYQFLTKPEYHRTVAQLNGDKYLKKLSIAALETLSIIAYKQPVSKGEIEAIRGVSSDYSIQKLLEKELIVIAGRSEELPGKPLLYNTSKSFMDYFGINSPAELPKVKEIFTEGAEPTAVQENSFSREEEVMLNGQHLSVSDTGELTIHEEAAETGGEEEQSQDADRLSLEEDEPGFTDALASDEVAGSDEEDKTNDDRDAAGSEDDEQDHDASSEQDDAGDDDLIS